MKKVYKGLYHIQTDISEPNKFYKDVSRAIDELQKDGQTVEVQYQQSARALSVLVLGYVMEKDRVVTVDN